MTNHFWSVTFKMMVGVGCKKGNEIMFANRNDGVPTDKNIYMAIKKQEEGELFNELKKILPM